MSLQTVNSSSASSWQNEPKSEEDGYLKVYPPQGLKMDLKSESVHSSNEVDGSKSQRSCTVSGVSVLAGKYVVIQPENSNNATNFNRGRSGASEWKCININTKEQFFCKVVPRNQTALTMLGAYQRLEQSNLVNSISEAIITPKVMYLIIPRHYGNLHSYLMQHGRLEEAEAANIFRQIVTIVQLCHSKGIVLRDIKLNRFVFIDKAKTILRLDSLEDCAVLANLSDDKLDDKFGCPNYVSPEKAATLHSKDLKYSGKSSDVWGLGIILYTLTVGRYPFHDTNHAKLMKIIRSGKFVLPSTISPSLATLINYLLKKNPKDRPGCKDILKSSWIRRHCWRNQVSSSAEDMLPDQDSNLETADNCDSDSLVTPSDQVVPNF